MEVSSLESLLRSEARTLSLREALSSPVSILLGVPGAASDALGLLGIETVFDLASSAVFADATVLAGAGSNRRSAIAQHGRAPTDILRPADTSGETPASYGTLGISALSKINEAHVAALESGLDLSTIGELASYPPFVAATAIMTRAYFPENEESFDPERPSDLLPKTGEYPTERVQYSTLLLDEIPMGDTTEGMDLEGPEFAPISLTALAEADAGFTKTAMGALLTFNQSWYAQGVTLGQLLHSTALAPGESTRIAVVDWSRRSRAGETESIAEIDDLSNTQSHNRSISEVASAVASEAQGGFSETNTSSQSSASATSAAGEMSAPLGGILGGASGSFGTSSSNASTTSNSSSYSNSWGKRSVASEMAQNVNDRTHQHAHSSRSRRASVVKEVSQSEHEEVSTRTLANYNHMHALTIQYYEVVQLFRVEVKLVKAERVIYIPFELLDFTQDATVRRFQPALVRAALNWDMRRALLNMDVVELELDKDSQFGAFSTSLSSVIKATASNKLKVPTALIKLKTGKPVEEQEEESERAKEAEVDEKTTAKLMRSRLSAKAVQTLSESVNLHLWNGDRISELSAMLSASLLRPGSTSLYLPDDVHVVGAMVESEVEGLEVVLYGRSGLALEEPSNEAPIPISSVLRIGLLGTSTGETATATLTVSRNGVRFPVELPEVTLRSGSNQRTSIVSLKGAVDTNLKKHLQDNRRHYSQAVFRALDQTDVALLLSPHRVTLAGKQVPVTQVVDARPHAVIGNYLAFRMSTDATSDPEWSDWLDDHGIRIGHVQEDMVPLGTGGVFAEAVLGRSNSAEKLDITRFWNWQDSPIPLQPTEIAAIQTGSRAIAEDISPGQLSNPIVNITSPTSLPDPTGMAGALAAIQNGNMFRDMSGLEATARLAQTAIEATSKGAAAAGQQAGENMNNLLKANTERQRYAADMIKTVAAAYLGGSSGGTVPASNSSEQGAKINYFDDNRGGAGSSGASGASGSTGGGAASGGGSGGSGGGSASDGGIATYSGSSGQGWSRNPAVLAATWGDSSSPTEGFTNAVALTDDTMGEPSAAQTGSYGSVPGPWYDIELPDHCDILYCQAGTKPILRHFVAQDDWDRFQAQPSTPAVPNIVVEGCSNEQSGPWTSWGTLSLTFNGTELYQGERFGVVSMGGSPAGGMYVSVSYFHLLVTYELRCVDEQPQIRKVETRDYARRSI